MNTFLFTFYERVSNTPRFVSIGNLIGLKNMNLVADAMSEVVHTYPDARLEIIGDGVERKRPENQVTDRSLNDRVTFRGALEKPAVQTAPRCMQMRLDGGLEAATGGFGCLARKIQHIL